MTLYVLGDLTAFPLAASGPDRPAPGVVTTVDDTISVQQGQPVTILPLANDTTSDSVPLVISAVGTPSAGAVQSFTVNQIVYRAPSAPFTGSVSLTYTALSSSGGQDVGNITISVTEAPVGLTPSLSNGWGPGPKSGYPYWLGCRVINHPYWQFGRKGTYVAATNANSSQAWEMNRNHDILDVWVPYTQPAAKYPAGHAQAGELMYNLQQQWDFIAGVPSWSTTTTTDANRNDATIRGGCMYDSWKCMWQTTNNPYTSMIPPETQGFKMNIALCPSRLSTKPQATGRWQFWWELAAGDYDIHFERLGARLGYIDVANNIRTGWAGAPSGTADNGHFLAGHILPQAPRFVVLGWEINDSQIWSYFNHTVQGGAYTKGGVTYPAGTSVHPRVPIGLIRVIDAMRAGYRRGSLRAGNQQDCPYYFGTRATARKQGGKGLREVMETMTAAQADEHFTFFGQSEHHTEQHCMPADTMSPANTKLPHATWYTSGEGIPTPFVTSAQEGLNQIGDLCTKWNVTKQVLLDETGQHFGGHTPPPPASADVIPHNGNRYPDLFWKSLDDWFKANNAAFRGGLHFYQGSSVPDADTAGENPVGVSDTSMIKNPARGWPGQLSPRNDVSSGGYTAETGSGNWRWLQTSQWWYDTYQDRPAGNAYQRPRPNS